MALVNCRECGKQVSTEAVACPHCGAPQRGIPPQIPPTIIVQQPARAQKKRMGLLSGCLLVFLGFFLVCAIAIAVSQATKSPGNGSSSSESSRPAPATDPKKAYVGAALGYLKTQNEQGMKVATAMARLQSGETTLTQIQKVIKDARFVTKMGFEGDYLRFGKLVVPENFSNVDQKVRRSYELRDAAFEEYLAYWKDNNLAHIDSASATFKQSEVNAQEATSDLNAQMNSITATVSKPSSAPAPTGFRSFNWGDVPTDALKQRSSHPDGTTMYVPSDGTKPEPLFDIPVAEEAFMFSNRHFFSGSAWVDGRENFEKMKTELTKRFGDPSFTNPKLSLWKWKWTDGPMEISLYYEARFTRTTVTFKNDKY